MPAASGRAVKTIGVEEHFVTDEVLAVWDRVLPGEPAMRPVDPGETTDRLRDAGERRLAAMDAAGLDVQVISLPVPGLHDLAAATASQLQITTNDRVAEVVAAAPERLQGFATLALPAPRDAARELERAVTQLGLQGALLFGHTGGRSLDHPDNWPIFAAAAELRVPLYLHTQMPEAGVSPAVGAGAGSGEAADPAAAFGPGWPSLSGVQFLRLVQAGVFDEFPDLQIILGQWGEIILFFLERIDDLARQAGLARTFSEYVRSNAYLTAGGIYSQRYLRLATELVGVERILFATDYPYTPGPPGGITRFLAESGLSADDQARVASGNWEALVGGIRR